MLTIIENTTIDNLIDELLTSQNSMHRLKIVNIYNIVKNMDIRTKRQMTLTDCYAYIYIFICTVMAIICQLPTVLNVNSLSMGCQCASTSEVN